MKIGFVGLGNVGAKLAGSLVRNELDVVVRDLDENAAQPLIDAGASFGESPKQMACLLYTSPSPRDLSTSRMPSSA